VTLARYEYGALPLATWGALEGLWLVVGVATVELFLRRHRVVAIATVVVLAVILGAAMTRSTVYCLPVLAVAAAALARQDLRRMRYLALWAALVSLPSLNYSVDFLGLHMNASLIRPFPVQLVSTHGHLL
jgi:hypothetical protein